MSIEAKSTDPQAIADSSNTYGLWVRNRAVDGGEWKHWLTGPDRVELHSQTIAWNPVRSAEPEVLDFRPIEHVVILPAGWRPLRCMIGYDCHIAGQPALVDREMDIRDRDFGAWYEAAGGFRDQTPKQLPGRYRNLARTAHTENKA